VCCDGSERQRVLQSISEGRTIRRRLWEADVQAEDLVRCDVMQERSRAGCTALFFLVQCWTAHAAQSKPPPTFRNPRALLLFRPLPPSRGPCIASKKDCAWKGRSFETNRRPRGSSDRTMALKGPPEGPARRPLTLQSLCVTIHQRLGEQALRVHNIQVIIANIAPKGIRA